MHAYTPRTQVGKPLMKEVFNGALPALVTTGFTSSFLMGLSVANLGGRFTMASLSDVIGCRSTYNTSRPDYCVVLLLFHPDQMGPYRTRPDRGQKLTIICSWEQNKAALSPSNNFHQPLSMHASKHVHPYY